MRMLASHALAAVLALSMLVFPSIWYFDPRSPFEFTDVRQVPPPARPGAAMSIRTAGVRHMHCPYRVNVRLLDGAGVRHDVWQNEADAAGALGPASYVFRFLVPETAEPGHGVYSVSIAYRCNPWQKFITPKVVGTEIPVTIEPAK